MLALNSITKTYIVGDNTVEALRGVTLGFRHNEFVSILGPSGCGKTTLLNIVGGLDRYTNGDLVINGRSTKSFSDADWDAYRNHSIGFVFQSYNLIPHQNVLTNVELALTISGVSKAERRKKAVAALERVGLGDQLTKKPNQLSGGQMQRVAIARAIVNNPDILLADEPTGALDTATSIQIMEILQEIASDRLVIMVTHNPELAEKYSTRIIRLQDGLVTDDSNPYDVEEASKPVDSERKKKKALSFTTALSLSLNNLLTKKTRTLLTSFAGSIGIIGIALILALSTGINAYIADVQEDALSSYPLSIVRETQDYSALLSAMVDAKEMREREQEEGKIYVDDSMGSLLSAMMSTRENNLDDLKKYLEAHYDEIADAVTDIRYKYNFDMQVYSQDCKTRVNPSTIVDNMGSSFTGMIGMMSSSSSIYENSYSAAVNVFQEMLDNQTLVKSQYDVVAGEWATEAHQVMLVINKNNAVTNMVLYTLGLKDQSEIPGMVTSLLSGEKYEQSTEEYTYEDFLGMTFYVVPNSAFYRKTSKTYKVDNVEYPVWEDIRESSDYNQESFAKENGIPITISAIIRPNPDAVSTSITGAIAYNGSLTKEMMALVRDSEIAKQQTETTPAYDVLSGLPYDEGQFDNLSPEQKVKLFTEWIQGSDKDKSAIMLDILSASSEELVSAEVNSMSVTDKCLYISNHMLELAEVSPSDYKDLMLAIMKMTMNDPNSPYAQNDEYKQYIQQFEAMDPETFIAMTGSMAGGSQTMTEEQIQQYAMALSAMQEEQLSQIVGKLLAASMTQESANDLLNQYTTAELASMFDKAFAEMSDDEKLVLYEKYMPALVSEKTYAARLVTLGFVDESSPASIAIYPKDFESKDIIVDLIAKYNDGVEEKDQIRYTDVVGIMMSSITTIIDAISYVLIAFVSISLVVSSIMIGIITYISVLERTKEIGILRAIGASKRDISKVFNAETLIVGFCSGFIGIILSVLLCFPINAIIHYYSGIEAINATLPVMGGVVLVLISMLLTFIAGLIPSGIASRKDPVLALRTE